MPYATYRDKEKNENTQSSTPPAAKLSDLTICKVIGRGLTVSLSMPRNEFSRAAISAEKHSKVSSPYFLSAYTHYGFPSFLVFGNR